MRRVRVIPSLLILNSGLVKTVKFKKPNYIGDPINAVKIFNEKEVDELVILDIGATKENKKPNLERLKDIVSEAFMPIGYGGGISTLDDIKNIINVGIEKVIINTIAYKDTKVLTEAAKIYGNQSIVVSVDVKKSIFGKYNAFMKSGTEKIPAKLEDYLKRIENAGAGEIILTSIDNEGTYKGYDFDLLKEVRNTVNIPIVINGGARGVDDFKDAILSGASAVAAGSRFVYKGSSKGILINYPTQKELKDKLYSHIQ